MCRGQESNPSTPSISLRIIIRSGLSPTLVPSRGFEPLIREEYAPKAYAYTVPPRGLNMYYIRLILNIEELALVAIIQDIDYQFFGKRRGVPDGTPQIYIPTPGSRFRGLASESGYTIACHYRFVNYYRCLPIVNY